MKKKIVIIVSSVILMLLLVLGNYIYKRMSMEFPADASYSEMSKKYITDDGMYFLKSGQSDRILYFLDKESGEEVVVCNKSNCDHNSGDCCAYVDEHSSDIIYYNGEIYICYSKVDSERDEDSGELNYVGMTAIDCVKSDGSKKYNIFSEDKKVVTSMKAVDEYLYFTAFNYHGEYKENTYVMDHTLYRYNLRWRKLEKLQEVIAKGTEALSTYTIIEGNTNEVYIKYSVIYDDDTQSSSILKYEAGKIKEINKFETKYAFYNTYIINDKKQYMILSGYDEDRDLLSIYESEDYFVTNTKLIEAENAWVDIFDGYMYVLESDYNKVLYDCEKEELYIANTCFGEEGKYISDVHAIDKNNNCIYIDPNDYTGIKPGTVTTVNPSSEAVADLSEFLDKNFFKKGALTEDDINKLTWVMYMK